MGRRLVLILLCTLVGSLMLETYANDDWMIDARLDRIEAALLNIELSLSYVWDDLYASGEIAQGDEQPTSWSWKLLGGLGDVGIEDSWSLQSTSDDPEFGFATLGFGIDIVISYFSGSDGVFGQFDEIDAALTTLENEHWAFEVKLECIADDLGRLAKVQSASMKVQSASKKILDKLLVNVALLEAKIDQMETNLDGMEGKLDLLGVEVRGIAQAILAMEVKIDRRFGDYPPTQP